MELTIKANSKKLLIYCQKNIKKYHLFPLKIKSPKETGKSFISNSRLKVNFFSKFVDYPVISDDSGLCIQVLKNWPGIYSARLAKKHGSFFKAMKFILKKMEKQKNRKATFICSLSYKSKSKKITVVEGKLKGNISTKIMGKKGFGYDPIFIPLKKKITFGQMSKSKKIKLDHRFIAFQKLRKKIKI